MNQRNNFKNPTKNNNSDDEIDSFNEEEENDLFMNKKELVHIENDTSINVDKSFEDDHSKTSTLKKGGLIINNISAINEQFSQGLDLSDKKMADANFFTKQLADFNDTENKNEPNPLKNFREIQNNIQINPTNYFETFNNLAITEENNKNEKKSNINILNNMIIGKKNYIINDKNKNIENFSITNFNHNYIGMGQPIINMNMNQNGESMISFRESQNKYKQFENKYFNLNNQYKKLRNEFDEINNSNKSLLELLSYWQKFYLEIKEIVLPEERKNNNDKSIYDYMDDPYRIQVIDEVKKLIIISRDKVYKNYYKTSINNFSIINNNKNNTNNIINKNWNKNLSQNNVESFYILKFKILNDDDLNDNINNVKMSKKFLDESDDLDFLPPMKYPEKINIGINTDNIESDNNNDIKFDSKKLFISKKINKYTYFEIKSNTTNNINSNNSNKLSTKQENPRVKKIISNSSNKNIFIKTKPKDLQINSLERICIKGKPTLPKKFKKNNTFKFAFIQTDLSSNEIDELYTFKNEKEIIIKQYEEKINTLNNYIKNNNLSSYRSNKKIINYNIKTNKENTSPNKNVNNTNSKIFLPEMIPPENTYKIFMNCIKNFKYEEGIYQKFLKEDDLYILKNFVEKMEKYLIGTSLPVLKAVKRKDYIIHTKTNNNESNTQKKYKERILAGNKPMYFNINAKKRNTSDSKNSYDRSNSVLNNNAIFNKYKAAIMSLKDE